MRPNIHLTPKRNWCNDPNGLCYFKGSYHFYYQYFPYGLEWGTMHWGHATTKDFLEYQHHDIALFPSIQSDMNGVFSGCGFVENDMINFFYTGVKYQDYDPDNIHVPKPQNNFIASQIKTTSKDGFNFSKKQVIIPPITDREVGHEVHTRDPKVWKHQQDYYMIIASKYQTQSTQQGVLLIYKSRDLENFEIFARYTRPEFGNMWECPNFFTINKQQYVIFSPENFVNNSLYPSQPIIQKANLDYSNGEFTVNRDYHFLDYGLDCYAPQVFQDEHQLPTVISWIRMPKPVTDKDVSYNGSFTMPRNIIEKDGVITYQVVSSIDSKFIPLLYPNFNMPMRINCSIKRGEYIDIGGYIISYNSNLKFDRTKVFPLDIGTIVELNLEHDILDLVIYIDENIIETFINQGDKVVTQVLYENEQYIDTNIADISYSVIP